MELFRLFGSIAIDNTEANHAIDDTAERANSSQQTINNAFGGIGRAVVSAGKLIAGAGLAIGGAILAVTESTREYRQEMGLLESAYKTAGHSSEAAKNTYSDLNAVMGDSGAAVEAAQHLALVADNEEELNDMTNTLTGVYSTFGASLPLEGLAEAINHSSSLGEVQSSLADALEWSGITVDDFNAQLAECSTEEERQDLIMTTLRNTYGKAAEQYKETNKDVMDARKAQERLSDAFAELGAVFEPIVTKIKSKIADMVAAAAPKIQELIDKIKDAITWIKENENTIHTWVAVILGAATSIGIFLLIMNWGTIMTAAAKAISTVRNAILLFNAALMANPIGIIVALLAGLVVAFIYLWNNVEPFRQFWINLWEKIQDACSKAASILKTKFTEMYNSMKEKFESMKQKATDIFNNIRNTISEKVQSAKDKAVSAFQLLKSGLIDPIVSAKNKVVEVFGSIYSTIKEKIESARNTVDNAIKKIKGFFNIDLKFKAIKMPSISVSWSKKPAILAKAAELLDIPGVPKFSVKWNAKGGIFDKPTVLPTLAGWQGFGEAGAEAITPIDTLLVFVREAVKAENEPVIYYMQRIMSILAEYMPQLADKDSNIVLDGNALVSRLAPRIDQELGILSNRKMRGNV